MTVFGTDPISIRLKTQKSERPAEYDPGHHNEATLFEGARVIPVAGDTIQNLNVIFQDPHALIEVPITGETYALGLWSGATPHFELHWNDEKAELSGTLDVEFWQVEMKNGKFQDVKTRRPIPLHLLRRARFEGYFPSPFQSTGLVLTDMYGERFPVQLAGLIGSTHLGVIPTAHVQKVSSGMNAFETQISLAVPFRLMHWTRAPLATRFPKNLDPVLARYLLVVNEFYEKYVPSRARPAKDELLSSVPGRKPLPPLRQFKDLIAEDILRPAPVERTHWLSRYFWACVDWLLAVQPPVTYSKPSQRDQALSP